MFYQGKTLSETGSMHLKLEFLISLQHGILAFRNGHKISVPLFSYECHKVGREENTLLKGVIFKDSFVSPCRVSRKCTALNKLGFTMYLRSILAFDNSEGPLSLVVCFMTCGTFITRKRVVLEKGCLKVEDINFCYYGCYFGHLPL